MTTMKSLVTIDFFEEEILNFQYAVTILRDYVVRGSCDIMGEFSSSSPPKSLPY